MPSIDRPTAAVVSLHITIIGAGISGLAAAISLARRGHTVRVLESNKKLSEFGAGIQVSPSATRILSAWGLRDAFEKVVFVPDVQLMRRYSTGEVIGGFTQNPAAEYLYGFPHWAIYRPDFQAILYEAALDAGAQVEFGQKMARIDIETGGVVLEGGSTVRGDLVIGADGIWSKTRSYIPETADVGPTPFWEYIYRAMVPRAVMMSNPLTASLMTSRHANGWFGPGQFVLGYPVASGQLYNVATPVPRSSDAPLMSWNTPGDVEEMRELFEGFCDTVRTLLGLVESCAKWTLGDLAPLETWKSANGKVLLVGDAAHAATPHAAQGGAQAIEDAAVLAECLSRIERLDDDDGLRRAVAAYEAIRKPRCESVQQMAKGSADMLVLPDGPAQEERDRKCKRLMEMQEQELRELGKAGIRAKPKPKPDMHASNIQTPGAQMWLHGYDAAEEARKYLAEL